MDASPDLIPALLGVTSIHVFGAGLNAERTSHTAVPELRKRGWRVVPVDTAAWEALGRHVGPAGGPVGAAKVAWV